MGFYNDCDDCRPRHPGYRRDRYEEFGPRGPYGPRGPFAPRPGYGPCGRGPCHDIRPYPPKGNFFDSHRFY